MIRKTISMPDEMDEFIASRVKAGQYGNDSEYIRDLVRGDQKRLATIERFQKLIDEGMEGEAIEIKPSQIFEEAMRGARKRRAK